MIDTDIPKVGRIVHYMAPGSADGTFPPAHRAAIVTEINDSPHVSLAVLNPQGIHFVTNIKFDGTRTKPFTWHWPER